MNKALLLQQIIEQLQSDLDLFEKAAQTAHEAATHEENIPDNKYATLALESSYIAQGQANRAQQVRQELARYKSLGCRDFSADDDIRLGALITLEAEAGGERMLFLGPGAGGMKVMLDGCAVLVVTPESPLGGALLGQQAGDVVNVGQGDFEIVDLC